MTDMADMTVNPEERRLEARQSPAGHKLTESQFDETLAIVGIVAREIHKSGAFRDKLSDYAHAFARSERFDTLKAEEIIRDVFKAYYQKTMNQMREDLMHHETELEWTLGEEPLSRANAVVSLIGEGPTMPFYRAYDQVAADMAASHGITETGAKELMKTAFATHHGRELYDDGKKAEDLYHKPTREAERSGRRTTTGIRRKYSRD